MQNYVKSVDSLQIKQAWNKNKKNKAWVIKYFSFYFKHMLHIMI